MFLQYCFDIRLLVTADILKILMSLCKRNASCRIHPSCDRKCQPSCQWLAGMWFVVFWSRTCAPSVFPDITIPVLSPETGLFHRVFRGQAASGSRRDASTLHIYRQKPSWKTVLTSWATNGVVREMTCDLNLSTSSLSTPFVARLVETVFQDGSCLYTCNVLSLLSIFLLNCLYTYKVLNASPQVHFAPELSFKELLSLASFYKEENYEYIIKASAWNITVCSANQFNNVRMYIPMTLMEFNTQGLLKVTPTHKDFSIAERAH